MTAELLVSLALLTMELLAGMRVSPVLRTVELVLLNVELLVSLVLLTVELRVPPLVTLVLPALIRAPRCAVVRLAGAADNVAAGGAGRLAGAADRGAGAADRGAARLAGAPTVALLAELLVSLVLLTVELDR